MADGAKPPGVPPETIRWFELLFFGSLMLRAVEIPQFISALSHGLAATISAGIRLFLTLLLPFWLALLVSRTRSNAAKWALVLLLALMMLGILAVYLTETSADLNILVLPALLMQSCAIALLFTAPARRWLDNNDTPSTNPELRDTFD